MDTTKKSKLNSAEVCFLLFFLLKPFYIFQSGSLQLGDLFLVISFGILFINRKATIHQKDKQIVYFIICVFAINVIYCMLFWNYGFLKSILYYIFNLFVIISFRIFSENEFFLSKLENVCKINLIIQLAIFLLGFGDYWGGTYRYMGTYNDPNQLGFAVISTLFILYMLKSNYLYLYILISIYLIIQTASTGMLFAISLLIVFNAIVTKKGKKFLFLVIIIALLLLFLSGIHLSSLIDFDKFRIDDKLNKGDNIFVSFIKDRNLGIILKHPIYFLFGFGEGMTSRYSGYHGELHSTMISICYYYGIIPFMLFVGWIYGNIKKIDFYYIPVYIALLLEACTLVNHRQPSFWMIIALASICKKDVF